MLPLPPTAQRQALRSIGSSKWALGVNEILDGVCVCPVVNWQTCSGCTPCLDVVAVVYSCAYVIEVYISVCTLGNTLVSFLY